jgi:25S rRNA (adenine2142-N1)-methyltransferase
MIDLNPQSPRVLKKDFFELEKPVTEDAKFHVVCLSLVVNFVPDALLRGMYCCTTLGLEIGTECMT